MEKRSDTMCRWTLMIWMTLSVLTGWAQQTIVTNKFTTGDGLSDNAVLCTLRDSYGLLWVGTENGLNCFDGQRIRVYRDMVTSESAHETNTVMALYEHEGDIWFGGTAGLYVFRRHDNVYSRFNVSTRYGVVISSAVQKIVGQDRLIWIITMGQGIFTYDTESGTLTQDSNHGSFFCDIIVGSDGLVYAVTLSGQLEVFRSDGQHLRSYRVKDYSFDKDPIRLVEAGGVLWLAYGTKLLRLNTTAHSTELQMELPALGAIHSLTADSEGQLLMGSDNGLYALSPHTSTIKRLDGTNEGNQLTDIMVNGLAWDTDSSLMVLTRTGGLNLMVTRPSGFVFVPLEEGSPSGERNIVHALCRGQEGELWIGTEHGLYRGYYPKHEMTHDTRVPPYEINALMTDGDDLWIGTRHNGIRVLNVKTGQTRSHTFSNTEPYTLPSNEVNSIYRTSKGDIYVLTSWGLSRFDRESGNFYGYANINAMTSFICMQEAASGWLWASSGNRGLFCKRTSDGLFDPFPSEAIGRQKVTVMHSDSQGDLWVATNGGGLYRYDAMQADFVRYDVEGSVLHGHVVSFICEAYDEYQSDDDEYPTSEQGVLWVGTSIGIVRISPSRDVQGLQVYSFPTSTRFFQQQRSSCTLGYGNILFGAEGGVYRFNASKMTPDTQQLRCYIQDMTLPYAADSRQELQRIGLDVLLYTRESIELPYADNSFTLHFSAARYAGMPTPEYEYMLKGFDQTWGHGTTIPEATYANLPPGDYEFLLRTVGQTNEADTARLNITILPPWYRTTLAYIIYILLIAAVIVGAYYLVQHRLKRRYQRQMQDFQQQQEKETFQSKIRFFVDLVHEIRTPLTLMSLPIEAINEELKTKSEGLNKHLMAIRRNMNYLLGITNQLLDFQKQENGGITLMTRQTDMREMLQQIYDQFSDAADVQGKHLQLQMSDEPTLLDIDSDKIMKVLMNLVGNALKYAQTEIIVRMTCSEAAAITVIDDGPGVPPEERSKIFDRYYQIANDSKAAHLGTGLGLAYSKMVAEAHKGELTYEDAPGGGSCFTLVLPYPTAGSRLPDHISQRKESADTPAIITPSDASSISPITSGGGGYRILLVEDNEELLRATADALRQWYKVTKAHDGLEALDYLKYQEADMIVSDIMMPRMNGIELCRRLKENIETSHLPVILLTAKVTVDAKTEGMESGADIYLEKPFSIRQLHAQIENLLRLRQQFYERMRNLDNFSAAAADTTGKPLGLNQQDLQFIEALQKSVEENMRDEEFNIDTLAEQLNLSRSSFYRKIKALTGITPTDYLKTARMNKAASLLRQGLRSSEVCERVGFTSTSYFAKCFRAQFGCLPKDYVQTDSDGKKEKP